MFIIEGDIQTKQVLGGGMNRAVVTKPPEVRSVGIESRITSCDVDADLPTLEFSNFFSRSMLQAGELETITSFHPHFNGRPKLISVTGRAQSEHSVAPLIAVAETYIGNPSRGRRVQAVERPNDDTAITKRHVRCRVLAAEREGYLVRTSVFDTAEAANRAVANDAGESDLIAAPFFRLWLRCRRLEQMMGGVTAALDTSGWAIIVLDSAKQVLFANREADAILNRGDALRRVGASLAAASLTDAIRLQVSLDHAANEDSHVADRVRATSIRLTRRKGRALIATIIPISGPRAPDAAAMIVYVVDPEIDIEPLLQPLCDLFQLSPVEGRLTVLIATGVALSDAAKRLRIKELTARSYLRQVFLKTETRRQADLVRVMMSSIVRTSSAARA